MIAFTRRLQVSSPKTIDHEEGRMPSGSRNHGRLRRQPDLLYLCDDMMPSNHGRLSQPKGSILPKKKQNRVLLNWRIPPKWRRRRCYVSLSCVSETSLFYLKAETTHDCGSMIMCSIAPFMVFSVTYYVESRNAVTSCSGARFFFERKWKRLFRRRNRT